VAPEGRKDQGAIEMGREEGIRNPKNGRESTSKKNTFLFIHRTAANSNKRGGEKKKGLSGPAREYQTCERVERDRSHGGTKGPTPERSGTLGMKGGNGKKAEKTRRAEVDSRPGGTAFLQSQKRPKGLKADQETMQLNAETNQEGFGRGKGEFARCVAQKNPRSLENY